MIERALVGSATVEFDGAALGDRRRSERLKAIASRLESDPSRSFPRAMGSEAALEAFYRFINGSGYTAADILEPHVASTLERARSEQVVIAVHDTTIVEYSGNRTGLGFTRSREHSGFVAHVGLLLSEADGLALGVAHLETWIRTGKKWRKRKKEGQRGRVHSSDDGRESLRWVRGIEAIEQARGSDFDVVHVTDAEGDFFELLARLQAVSGRHVIRAGQLDRIVISDGEERSLREVVQQLTPVTWRKIELSERKHGPRISGQAKHRRHPARAARTARVAIASQRVGVKKTSYSNLKAEPFDVNVVRVWEPRPKRAEPPVEWILLTTEDTSSIRALERIVDIYRRRWVIEDYFKALKSGCSLEKRQIESYAALCKILALFVPIASRLLALRGLERRNSRTSAKLAFSQTDLHLISHAPCNRELKQPRTISEALLQLARLGGHIKNNGPPGWQTLGWGYEKLLALRIGWEMALASRSDQS
jgi:hypothetical protein